MLKRLFLSNFTKEKGFIKKKIIFQQDGARAHFSKEVRTWLNENFNDKWIGREWTNFLGAEISRSNSA